MATATEAIHFSLCLVLPEDTVCISTPYVGGKALTVEVERTTTTVQ